MGDDVSPGAGKLDAAGNWPDTAEIPIYVINVAAHAQRLEAISARAAELDLRLIRWPATVGADLDPAMLSEGRLADGIRVRGFAPWSGNEAACGISHLRLLRQIAASGAQWAVVLEDDAVILHQIPVDIGTWGVPADADIVLLNDRSVAGVIEVTAGRFAYGKVVGGAGTDGYLISRAGVEKMLCILDPLKDPLDFQMYSHFASVRSSDEPPFLWRLPGNAEADDVELIAYRIDPPLIGHDGKDSVIGNERHPRARFYCQVLLGQEFSDYTPYLYTYPGAPPMAAAPARLSSRFFKGVDISQLYSDGQVQDLASLPGDPLGLLQASGVNAIRMSAWTGASTPLSTDRLLSVAREAAGRGLDLCVALHYSDTWADPGSQWSPASWQRLSRSSLDRAVFTYTYQLVSALCQQRTPPAVVQVGNEITNGMLWAGHGQDDRDGGRLWRGDWEGEPLDYDRQWEVFAALVRTAVAGVRNAAADWDAAIDVMVHIDTGAYVAQADWWLRRALDHGITFDLIGLSFYPMWHNGATIRALEALGLLCVNFPGTGIVLAETAFPYRLPADGYMPYDLEFPVTPSGQRDYLATAFQKLRRLPTGRGLFWWGGFFTEGADCYRAHALLDDRGRPVPALAAFAGA
jgi:arabinogalactan endo-1,4-beta-galactosidase